MNIQNNGYSGQLGLILLLDDNTNSKAVKIAERYMTGNKIDLARTHTPHMTLFHSKVKDVPSSFVKTSLDHLKSILPITLTFTQAACFGGKFLFWDTERSSSLLEAHGYALNLAKFFTPLGEQQSGKEKLGLSDEESANVSKYGHPLVNNLWRPHITLGYYPDGIEKTPQPEPYIGMAIGAAFIKVGDFGTIAEIIKAQSLL